MYFEVIKSGKNRKLVYDFLLVVYSNFCRITHPFWEIWCETVQWPWNIPKVIDSRIVSPESCRVAMYVKCSEDSERMKRKSPFSTTPLSFDAPSPANPREYLHIPYTARNCVPWATFFVADSIWIALQIFEQFCPKAGDAKPSVAFWARNRF